jgi:hypothetical protein
MIEIAGDSVTPGEKRLDGMPVCGASQLAESKLT